MDSLTLKKPKDWGTRYMAARRAAAAAADATAVAVGQQQEVSVQV